MKTIDILKKARKLILKGWTKGESARDKSGHPTRTDSSSAVKFCALGAIERASSSSSPLQSDANYRRAVVALRTSLGLGTLRFAYDHISDFNDNRKTKKADVVKLFDQAIKRPS